METNSDLVNATAHAEQASTVRCIYCDDTGDVTRADGEWMGRCTCAAGEWTKSDQEFVAAAIKEQSERFAAEAADDEAVARSFADSEPCGTCSGTGVDGEECSDRVYAGPCRDCYATGRVPRKAPEAA